MSLFETPTKYQLITKAVDLIKTIVFLKVDVPDINYEHISEISLISVHINELTGYTSNKTQYPRIVDKLTLCFDPITSYNKHMSCMGKINNAFIKDACKRVFDENACSMIVSFLQKQEGPICFLCHNGFRLDYQVLQSALKNVGRSLVQLCSEIVYCADSLWTFKAIDANAKNPSKTPIDVSVFDMVFYTLNSIYTRYMHKDMPEALSAEERNLFLLQLVYHNSSQFLKFLCCKNFSLVKPRKQQSCESFTNQLNINVDHSIMSVNEIQTYVFVDLETTSLQDAKITELCMIAIHKSSFTETQTCNNNMPRIQDKILLAIHPDCQIQYGAEKVSGISNKLLNRSSKQIFDNSAAWLIDRFLQQQYGSICFVAHNGDNFDFPILYNTFKPYFDICPAFCKVFCADSLQAMRLKWQNEFQNSQNTQSYSQKKSKMSFSLQNVYKKLFPSSDNSFHSAEADVVALVQIFNAELSLFDELSKRKFF